MPPRLSLPSLICPAAPFLLPITTRIALRAAKQHLEPWTVSRAYGSNSSSKSKQTPSRFLKQKKREKIIARPHLRGLPEDLQLFRKHVSDRDISQAMDQVSKLAAQSLMVPHNTLLIAQLLHTEARLQSKADQGTLEMRLSYARMLVHDIRNGAIQPHHGAILHLISFFKVTSNWQEGIEFWTWCRAQDEAYVNASVYGAAIELLTYSGSAPLEELEELYQEGLTRFPGTFAAYHMSPDAIVADRAQHTSFAGLPMTLLQGILTARLVHGDWQKAYLSLDIAFRLYPTQVPSRFFEIFFYERPLAEAFTVAMIAVRSGKPLKPVHLNHLLVRLNAANRYNSPKEQITTLHNVVIAMHAHLGVGASLRDVHLSSLITGFEVLLPSPSSDPETAQDADLRDCVISAAQRIIADFREAGIETSRSVYCTLMVLLGKARLPAAIGSTFQEMVAAGHEPNEISCRVLVSAFGESRDTKTLEASWKLLVELAEAEGRPVSQADWITFAKAVRATQNVAFLEKQKEELSHTLTVDIVQAMDRQLEKDLAQPQKKNNSMDAATLASELESIHGRVGQLLELFKSGSLLDFKLSPTPLFLESTRPALGFIEDLRAIYDELTTDPRQPPPPEGTSNPRPLSPTGFTIDELRFQNWIAILEVMADAEANDSDKSKIIDEAIDTGSPMPGRVHAPLYRKYPQTQRGVVFPSRDDLRKRILQLRGVHQATQLT